MAHYGETFTHVGNLASRHCRIVGDASLRMLVTFSGTATWADELPADHAAQMAHSMELFKADVRGLLVQNCLKCHGGEKTKGEFDLSTREGLLKGGEQGPGDRGRQAGREPAGAADSPRRRAAHAGRGRTSCPDGDRADRGLDRQRRRLRQAAGRRGRDADGQNRHATPTASSGRSSRLRSRSRRRSRTKPGAARRSIASCWRRWKPRASRPTARPIAAS